jgi:hypothetical protein
MIELDRSRHAQPLHDPHRRFIPESRQRNDLRQANARKPIFDRCSSRLSGVSSTPILAVETPGDFNRRRERGLELYSRQSDRADKRRDTGRFDGPLAEARFDQMVFRTLNVGVALRPREHAR